MVYESDKEKNSADVDLERTFVFLNHPPPLSPLQYIFELCLFCDRLYDGYHKGLRTIVIA
jgi:hypothetical protein